MRRWLNQNPNPITLILALTLTLLTSAGAHRGRRRAVRRAYSKALAELTHLTECWLGPLPLTLTLPPTLTLTLTRCAELTPLSEWAFALVPAEATL